MRHDLGTEPSRKRKGKKKVDVSWWMVTEAMLFFLYRGGGVSIGIIHRPPGGGGRERSRTIERVEGGG